MKSKLAFVIMFIGLSISQLTAQNGTWENLGMRKVDFGLDRDEIPVTWRDGKFDAIKFVVRGGSINMHKVIVHFENGGTQEIQVKHTFGRGDDSRVIDLKGNNRFIEKVVFWYDTKNFARRKATISLWGRH